MKHLNALLLVTTFPAFGGGIDCQSAITTPEVNECARLDLEKVELLLNSTYKSLMNKLSQPDDEVEKYSEMRKGILEAQRAWIKFREADCQAIYTVHASGTIRTVAYLTCMKQRAEQRIKELNNYGV